MADPALIRYITEQLAHGYSPEQVRSAVLTAGWQEAQVTEAFSGLSGQSPSPPPPPTAPGDFPGAIPLLKESFRFYQSRLGHFAALTLLPLLPSLVIQLTAFLAAGLMVQLVRSQQLPILIVGVVVIVLVTAVLQTWGTIAVFIAATDTSLTYSLRTTAKRALSLILSFWWLSFLEGLIILGGFLVFMIPGLLLSIRFLFSQMALIVDNQRGSKALIRSQLLMKGYGDKVLVNLLILGLIGIVLYIPGGILEGLSKQSTLFSVAGGIYNFILLMVLTPVSAIFLGRMYLYIRNAKTPEDLNPGKVSKLPYVLFGILGGLIIPVFIGMGVLAVINVPKLLQNASDTAQQNTIHQIQTALEMYHVQYGVYPDTLEALLPDQMNMMPEDPQSHAIYEYTVKQNGTSYSLCPPQTTDETQCVSPTTVAPDTMLSP